jgi:hypothetical protein
MATAELDLPRELGPLPRWNDKICAAKDPF